MSGYLEYTLMHSKYIRELPTVLRNENIEQSILIIYQKSVRIDLSYSCDISDALPMYCYLICAIQLVKKTSCRRPATPLTRENLGASLRMTTQATEDGAFWRRCF